MSTSPLNAVIDLSNEINAAYKEARAHASAVITASHFAVVRAIECGQLLTRQKESLPHGEWQPWLAKQCPQISSATARRYMRLAKQSQTIDLQNAAGLRQAYLATGVLPAEDVLLRKRSPDVNTPTITFVRGLDHFRRWFNRRTEEVPLDQWSPETRRYLRSELTWFKKLYDRLAS